jgi:hypothetical protein
MVYDMQNQRLRTVLRFGDCNLSSRTNYSGQVKSPVHCASTPLFSCITRSNRGSASSSHGSRW